MMGSCCSDYSGGRPAGRRARMAAGSVISGAVLLLLPKCPVCLAAWLTAASGVGISAAAAADARWFIAGLWITGLALAVLQILRRRGSAAS